MAQWFSVGLLHLHQISWHTSPGALLEKVPRLSSRLIAEKASTVSNIVLTHAFCKADQALTDYLVSGTHFYSCVQVMAYEAVHPFTGWGDLQQRLASNRRVFGYFHSSLPDEPLVLLHTALMDAVPSAIDEILQGVFVWLSGHCLCALANAV